MAGERPNRSSVFIKLDQARRVLGLPEVVNFVEIQRAYHEQSRRWHPDQHPENSGEDLTERMREINGAYKILKDYVFRYPISFRREDSREPWDAAEWWWNRFGTVFGQDPEDDG
jgi:hypothetical protein